MPRLLLAVILCSSCGVPTPAATVELWAGIEALEAGDASAALEAFDRVGVAPHASLSLNRGLALHHLGDEPRALTLLDEALALSSDTALRARVLTDRGTVRARAGRTHEAIADYREALHLDPRDELARHNLELLLRMLRDDLDVDPRDDDSFLLDQPGPLPSVELASVVISPDPGTAVLEAYWRSVTYDTFDGRRWSARSLWATQAHSAPRALGPPTMQTISFVGRADATLFGLDHAASFTAGSTPIARRGWDGRASERVRSFTVTSTVEALDDESEPLRYGQLPLRVDPRLRPLALSITGAEQDPERAAWAIQTYLRANASYSQVRQERALDPLAAFLFSSKRGDCRLFASSLAVLLRTRGFEARVVGGFRGGRRVGKARYQLTSTDLHAWVEVRGHQGWVRFDPTPASTEEPLTIAQATSLLDAVRGKSVTRFDADTDAGIRPKPTRDW